MIRCCYSDAFSLLTVVVAVCCVLLDVDDVEAGKNTGAGLAAFVSVALAVTIVMGASLSSRPKVMRLNFLMAKLNKR